MAQTIHVPWYATGLRGDRLADEPGGVSHLFDRSCLSQARAGLATGPARAPRPVIGTLRIKAHAVLIVVVKQVVRAHG